MGANEQKKTSGWVRYNVARHWWVIAKAATEEDIAQGSAIGKLHLACNRYYKEGFDFDALQDAIHEYQAAQER